MIVFYLENHYVRKYVKSRIQKANMCTLCLKDILEVQWGSEYRTFK